jgi:hypothetical protein
MDRWGPSHTVKTDLLRLGDERGSGVVGASLRAGLRGEPETSPEAVCGDRLIDEVDDRSCRAAT